MTELRGVRAVVTGGAGFIGSHLVDALLAVGAARVAVVDTFFLGKEENLYEAQSGHEEALAIYREDAGDFGAMCAVFETEKPDLVFNLATKALLYSFFNPVGACKVNLDVALCLGELLRKGAFGRLVHVSSSEVYGTARRFPMDEEHPLLGETSYAAGKAAADLFLASYVSMFGVDVVTVRPFNNYGPRQNDGSLAAVVPLTIGRLQRGEPPVIEGDGLQTRDFFYVQDTVEIVLRVANSEQVRGQVLNVGSGRETTIREIVDGLCSIFGYTGEIRHSPQRKADVRRHCADVGRINRLIGSIPTTNLEAGLETTVAWFQR